MTRRRLLRWATRGMGAVVAAVVLVPGVATLLSPVLLRERGPMWRALGPLDSFPRDHVSKGVVQVEQQDAAKRLAMQGVFVWREADGEVVVYARNCTDLSCPVTWDGGSQWFFCPCHGGVFSKEGEPVAGPPQRPLWRFTHRIRDGVLEIDLNSVPPIA